MQQDPVNRLLKTSMFLLDWQLWVAPAFFVVLGLAGGLVAEKLLVGAIRRLLKQVSIALDEHIASVARWMVFWLCALWGVYMGLFAAFPRNQILKTV